MNLWKLILKKELLEILLSKTIAIISMEFIETKAPFPTNSRKKLFK